MRFKMAALLAVIVLGLALTGQVLAAEKITWKLGGVHAVTTPETKGLKHFADLVKKKTGGEFVIHVYPAGQLGKKAVTLIENLQMGSIDMFGNVMDWNQHLVKDFGVMAMPFVFKDVEAVKKFQKSDLYKSMKNRMVKEKGIRMVADNWYRLPKVLLANKPIMNLKDLKGLKIRMPSLKTYFETWKILGAKPTVIAWSEAFLSLKKGVVDGLDSPLGSVYGMKFYQAAPYIMMTNHLVAPMDVLVNEKKYQALPDAYKKALLAAGKEAGDYYTKLVVDMFKKDKVKMDKTGVKFLKIDVKPFAQKAAEAAKMFEAQGMWQKGLFKKITESY